VESGNKQAAELVVACGDCGTALRGEGNGRVAHHCLAQTLANRRRAAARDGQRVGRASAPAGAGRR